MGSQVKSIRPGSPNQRRHGVDLQRITSHYSRGGFMTFYYPISVASRGGCENFNSPISVISWGGFVTSHFSTNVV